MMIKKFSIAGKQILTTDAFIKHAFIIYRTENYKSCGV